MVAALLRWKLRASLAGDPIAEDGLLPLELARLIIGIDPVGDLVGVAGLVEISSEQPQLTMCRDLSYGHFSL